MSTALQAEGRGFESLNSHKKEVKLTSFFMPFFVCFSNRESLHRSILTKKRFNLSFFCLFGRDFESRNVAPLNSHKKKRFNSSFFCLFWSGFRIASRRTAQLPQKRDLIIIFFYAFFRLFFESRNVAPLNSHNKEI
jgi:hypothetical protein